MEKLEKNIITYELVLSEDWSWGVRMPETPLFGEFISCDLPRDWRQCLLYCDGMLRACDESGESVKYCNSFTIGTSDGLTVLADQCAEDRWFVMPSDLYAEVLRFHLDILKRLQESNRKDIGYIKKLFAVKPMEVDTARLADLLRKI